MDKNNICKICKKHLPYPGALHVCVSGEVLEEVNAMAFEPLFTKHKLCAMAMNSIAIGGDLKSRPPVVMAFLRFLPGFIVDAENLYYTATGVSAMGYFGVRCRFNILFFPAIHDTMHKPCREIQVRGFWETLGDGLLILDRCDRVIVID